MIIVAAQRGVASTAIAKFVNGDVVLSNSLTDVISLISTI